MKTLKVILITVLVAFTVAAQAQLAEMGTTTFGLRAGVNFQNINGKDFEGDKLENDLVPRWHAGVNVEFPIAPDFFIQPGILFSTKGAKIPDAVNTPKINLGYVEVPLNLIYKPLLGTGHVILGFGPYVAYGLTGKVKFENDDEADVEFTGTVDANPEEGVWYFKPLDIGANMLAGYEFSNGFSFQLNTQLGLTDINPDYEGIPDDESKLTNTGFGLSLGYRL
jgi:hypothetical protein